jgi:predicted Zn-ribbon and HTH transcriptional regulator
VGLLVPEPANHHDRNAVRVVIQGQLVGYLSREDATAYLPGLHRLIARCDTGRVALEGVICGGGQRDHGIGFLGVFLDHDPIDFGVAPHHMTGGTLRTGLSEAIATDLGDDRYDLSWLSTLDQDDEEAVTELQRLLIDEREPIDRHFMFSELEHRLYSLRKTRTSALNEFDAACAQHHDEMGVLRPALLAKFGVVPVIEMYRQASIRCQKDRRWAEVGEWAQRGLDVYGERAARQEAVDDLHKRLAHAMLKLEQKDSPSDRKQRSVGVSTQPLAIETLVCNTCGKSFERTRTRGRKPKLCPTCRGPTIPSSRP